MPPKLYVPNPNMQTITPKHTTLKILPSPPSGDRFSWTGDAHVAQATAMAALGNFDFVSETSSFSGKSHCLNTKLPKLMLKFSFDFVRHLLHDCSNLSFDSL